MESPSTGTNLGVTSPGRLTPQQDGRQRPGANGRLRPDDAPALPRVLDDPELGVRLDPALQSSRRQELVEKTPTATVQLEGPGGSMGRDLHIEEICDHLVALLLLLRPLWRFVVEARTRSAGGRLHPGLLVAHADVANGRRCPPPLDVHALQ